MKPAIKKKWLEALRSGQYRQCRDRLTNGRGFCCLGVLTNLYFVEKGGTWARDEYGDVGVANGAVMETTMELPTRVTEWAGLKNSDPEVNGMTLSFWNDGERARFKKIADLIEKYL